MLVCWWPTVAGGTPEDAAVPAHHEDPPLSVPDADLAAALHCPPTFTGSGEPVLLVHGTFATGEENYGWNYLAELPDMGFDVCYVDLPERSTGDIQVSSEYVVAAVRAIHAATGEQVDVLGHSQGGLQPRWMLRWWPTTRELVDDLVTLATPHHGTTAAQFQTIGCKACFQMRPGSNFLNALNSGDETPGPVSYTSIYSELLDELVQPPETARLNGGTSLAVQDVCPARFVDHVSIVADAVVFAMVLDAFTHPGATDTTRLPADVCTGTFFPDGAGLEGFMNTFRETITNPTVPEGSIVTEEPPLAPYVLAHSGPDDPQAAPAGPSANPPSGSPAPVAARPSFTG